ncbi:Serine protease inhibitor 28, partial [Operophtera brumata]
EKNILVLIAVRLPAVAPVVVLPHHKLCKVSEITNVYKKPLVDLYPHRQALRHMDQILRSKKQCIEPKCKGKHEVYSKCIQGECRPKTCSEVGCPIPCPRIDPKYCKKGCICKEGYVKNKKGVCIPIKQCRKWSLLSSAFKTLTVPVAIILHNYLLTQSFLMCKYVYSCTTVYQCKSHQSTFLTAPVCKKDEVYSDCINGGCSPVNCSQIGHPVPCVKLDPKYCIKGCLCKDGYLRDENGVCVPKEECKRDFCIAPCPPRRCDVDERLIKCAPPPKIGDPLCVAGCRCADGYYRNNYKVCVTKAEC